MKRNWLILVAVICAVLLAALNWFHDTHSTAGLWLNVAALWALEWMREIDR